MVGAVTVFFCYDSDVEKNSSNEKRNKRLHETACHKEKQSYCRKYEAKNDDYLSKGFHTLLVLVLSIGKNKHLIDTTMSKDVKFNINLSVNGKDVVVQCKQGV